MKVVFLDFDGVLKSEKYVLSCREGGVVLDPSKMVLLKQIVYLTDAKIVLSTSWREHWENNPTKCNSTGRQINDIFAKYGLHIFDKTPKLHLGREQEIKSWLDRHAEVDNFVVLDDMFLSADFLEGHFVKTSNYLGGLDGTAAENAVRILNR